MDHVTIRAAAPTDAEVVEDYHHRCFVKSYAAQIEAGEFGPPERGGTRDQLRSWFQPGSAFATSVAIVNEHVVGHFTVNDHNLVHLFVDPDHHGTGLGLRLLTHGEGAIAAAGHAQAELHTRVENTHAIGFYQRWGWTLTDRTIHTVEHGISYHEHVMTKRLA